jgi:hypothetical protein
MELRAWGMERGAWRKEGVTWRGGDGENGTPRIAFQFCSKNERNDETLKLRYVK